MTFKAYCTKFPTVAVIILVIGVLWLLSDLNILKVDIPWWPVILIIIAIGWIINRYSRGNWGMGYYKK